jgi:hypothetical protein
MSARKPSFTAPTAGAGRLAVVLNAGLERKLASLALVSIDAKGERQGKEAWRQARSTPYTPRRATPSSSGEEQRQQQLATERQRQLLIAEQRLKQRPVVRTQDRETEEEGARPVVVRNDNPEHRRIFAVVCYTGGFDRMLVAMTKDPDTEPFALHEDMSWLLGGWDEVYPALAFFGDTMDSLEPGPALVEAKVRCSVMELSYEDKEKEQPMMLSLLEMGNTYAKKDADDNPTTPGDDDIGRLAYFMNDGINAMMREFKSSFAPWAQWASTSVEGLFDTKDQSFMSYMCKAQNLLFSGNRVSPVDPNRLSKRMLSTSYRVDAAMTFAKPRKNVALKGTLMVFVVDLDVEVVNVNAATSLVGDEFMCFSNECEVVVECGCTYVPIVNLDDYPVQNEEWKMAWDEFKELPQKEDWVQPDVAFFRVMPPRR